MGVLVDLSGFGGSSRSGRSLIDALILVVVFGPLVVIGLNTSCVLLIRERLCLNGVVRASPTAILVGAIGLLGVLVSIKATSRGRVG